MLVVAAGTNAGSWNIAQKKGKSYLTERKLSASTGRLSIVLDMPKKLQKLFLPPPLQLQKPLHSPTGRLLSPSLLQLLPAHSQVPG